MKRKPKYLAPILFWSSLLFFPLKIMGASCCGSGSSLPSLITGDTRTQINLSMTRSKLLGKQLSNFKETIWTPSDDSKTQKIFLQGSYLFDNYIQIGLGLPYFFKQNYENRIRKSNQYFGDVELQAAYEVLPEVFYSNWLPRVFIFSKITVPTGSSIYEKESYDKVEVTGQGHSSVSLGALFLKAKSSIDIQFMAEIHKGLKRRFTKRKLLLEPGLGASALLSAGFSPSNNPWRWGISLSPNYEGPKTLTFSNKSFKTDYEFYWDTTASGSYLYSRYTSFHFAITDQTILGPVHNTSLSRTFSLNVQKRWPL